MYYPIKDCICVEYVHWSIFS